MIAYRCKVRKADGSNVDGCGHQVTSDQPLAGLACTLCHGGYMRALPQVHGGPLLADVLRPTVVSLAPSPATASVELLPGVHVGRDIHGYVVAYGPGLDAALQTAADVATLDTRAPWQLIRTISPNGWQCEVGREYTRHLFRGPTANAARRAAADAIRKGKIPT